MKKTYLNKLSPEIITKRLNDGEVVKCLGKDSFKLVNGTSIKFDSNNNNNFWVGGSLFINSADDYYFEDPEPITETGAYKTREGKKVYITMIKHGIIFGFYDGSTDIKRWNSEGKAYANDIVYACDEIIGKWEENDNI